MKIKKISMIGFKSFVDRLDIPFPMGLSAIVGPNGCGKSNIVDAIRWAMGEQSAKLLRGRQMEDIIFNGSDDYKPLGMAEVSLLLENGNGSFPDQFIHESELSITRRLYRSGESEYLINNVPCRLKDVQELFMDTGLGNKAYSIIGQGKISTIIEQKPEETRAMLEEAAGITKYKKKVEESQRKIELTKVNLQRVEDILGEVERQIKTLKRQAAKAKRYKAIGQEIQRLDLIWNAQLYAELKEETGTKIKSSEGMVQEEIARTTEFSSIQARIETMNLDLEEKEQVNAGLRDTYLRSKERVSKKESLLESTAAEMRLQLELESRLIKDKEDLGRKQKELHQEKLSLLQRIEEVKQSALGMDQEISLLEKRAKARADLLREIKEAYEEARGKVHDGTSREMSLAQESGYLSKRIHEITDSRARLEKEKEDIQAKIKGMIPSAERKNQLREALHNKLQDIEGEIGRAQEDCEELEQAKKGMDADLKAQESQLNMDQSRLASLRSLTENFEGYKSGVRTIMKANDLEPRQEGRILGLVADILHVDPKYEQALETLLSDKLQYVIVEEQKDGKKAIDYLKTRAKGRGSFAPIKDLRQNGEKGGHNGFPLMKGLVSVAEPYRPLMNVLLGDAVVVENLDQAMSAWSGNGDYQCLVTLDGDMVDRYGVISGGKLAHSTHGILARKREIGELEKVVITHSREVDEMRARLEQAVLEKENKEKTLQALIEGKWSCQEEINNLEKAIFKISHEMDQLERLSERISEELAQKDREGNRHNEALGKIESELKHCTEKRKKAEEYLDEKEKELKGSQEEFEQIREELSRLRMSHSRTQEEHRGLLREVERIDTFAREAEQAFLRMEKEIGEAQERYRRGMINEGKVREELQAHYEDLAKSEEALHLAEQERNLFRNQIREIEKKGEAIREEVEAIKEKIHLARMEESEIRFKMEGLLATIKDKYGQDLSLVYQEYPLENFSPAEIKERLDHQKIVRERLGEVNLTAIQEHEALMERHSFISTQRKDLLDSIESLNEAIRKINRTCVERFTQTFNEVNEKLKMVFPILFNGGSAGLKLIDESKPLESGVLVEVRPPGKKVSHMGLLSGGEKALVAMALIFAIYLIKPSPFLLLDEVDAPLDEANIDRFNDLLKEIRKYSQIILVTHNRRTMEIVDRLFGVTMERQGVSKIVSVNLEGFRSNDPCLS